MIVKTPVVCEYDADDPFRGTRLLVDATQRQVAVCDTAEDADEIASIINGHAAMVAALIACRDLLCGALDGVLEDCHQTEEAEMALALTETALAKAEEETHAIRWV